MMRKVGKTQRAHHSAWVFRALHLDHRQCPRGGIGKLWERFPSALWMALETQTHTSGRS